MTARDVNDYVTYNRTSAMVLALVIYQPSDRSASYSGVEATSSAYLGATTFGEITVGDHTE